MSHFLSFSRSLSLSLLIYLSTHLPIYLSTFLPIYLPIHLSIDLSEHQLRKWVGKWREWRRKGASTHWNAMYITSHSSCHFPCFPCVPHGFTAGLCASKLLASIHADENAWCHWGFTRGSPTDFVMFIWQTLVGGIPTPLKKYEYVSWDDDIPNLWKVIKAMFQSTNQPFLGTIHRPCSWAHSFSAPQQQRMTFQSLHLVLSDGHIFCPRFAHFTPSWPWLVGGWPTPLKNMSSSVGMIIPNIWKIKSHVPNHQSADIHF